MPKKVTNEQFLTKLEKNMKLKHFTPLEKYMGMRVKIKFQCTNFKHKFYISPHDIFSFNRKCPECTKTLNDISKKDSFLRMMEEKNILKFLTPLEEYKGMNSKILVQCNFCKREWSSLPSNFIYAGRKCSKCAKNKPLTNEDVDEKLKGTNIKLVGNINGSSKKSEFACELCKERWFANVSSVIWNKSHCKKCHIRKSTLLYNNEYVDNILKYKNIKRVGNITDCKTKIDFLCQLCKYIWKSKVRPIATNKTGCPSCNLRKNEKLTKLYLQEITKLKEVKCKKIKENIFYKNIKIRNFIIVDFYFEYRNKKYIVEYNGPQHYILNGFFIKNLKKAKNKLKEQKIRDKWLRKYCKKNSIILIEIDGRKYTNEKIKKYLLKKLSKSK